MKKPSTLSTASPSSLFIALAVIGLFSVCSAHRTPPYGTFLDLKPADFRQSQLLGRGSFGEVYKVRLDQQDYALKVATTTNRDHSFSQLKNEQRILDFLQQRLFPAEKTFFLLPPKKYGSTVFFNNPYERRFVSGSGLLMPLCAPQIEGEPADLFELINVADSEALQPWRVLQMALEISRAVQALHRVGVIHGDIKAENVMFKASNESELSAVLADFGSSWLVGERDSLVITPGYAAPERVIAVSECVEDYNSQYCFSGTAGDVYSFAVLLVVMLNQDLNAIDNIKLSHAAPSVIPISAYLDNLIERSLSNNPEHRPRIDELATALDKELNQNPTNARKNTRQSQHVAQFQALDKELDQNSRKAEKNTSQFKKLFDVFENSMFSDQLTATRKKELLPKSVDKTEKDHTRLKNRNPKPFRVHGQQQKRTTSSDAPNNDHQNEEQVKMSVENLEQVNLNDTSRLQSSLSSRVKGTPWEKQLMRRNSKENVKKSPRRMLKQSK